MNTAHERHPNNPQIMFALATMERDRGNLEVARSWAEKMLSVNPADQNATQLLEMLKGPVPADGNRPQ